MTYYCVFFFIVSLKKRSQRFKNLLNNKVYYFLFILHSMINQLFIEFLLLIFVKNYFVKQKFYCQ